jgi:hypothetical protein
MKGVTKLILNTPNLDIPPKPRFSAIDAYISESWPDVDQEKQEGSDEH